MKINDSIYNDINKVRFMMEQVKEAFPGYQETEFLEALDKAIDDKEALLEEKEGRLAVMPEFRTFLYFY